MPVFKLELIWNQSGFVFSIEFYANMILHLFPHSPNFTRKNKA